MKKILLFSVILAVGLLSCKVQDEKEVKIVSEDSIQPDTIVKVNKKYDKNGNLIQYDSLYSYYYSNIAKDSVLRDSILSQFKKLFNEKYFFSEEPYFNKLFFEDSLLKYDFYKKDFFSNRFLNNSKQMEQMFREMDSLKNIFFEEQKKILKK